jgi:hypothetical protein
MSSQRFVEHVSIVLLPDVDTLRSNEEFADKEAVLQGGQSGAATGRMKRRKPDLLSGMASFRFGVFARDSKPHVFSAGKDKNKFQF